MRITVKDYETQSALAEHRIPNGGSALVFKKLIGRVWYAGTSKGCRSGQGSLGLSLKGGTIWGTSTAVGWLEERIPRSQRNKRKIKSSIVDIKGRRISKELPTEASGGLLGKQNVANPYNQIWFNKGKKSSTHTCYNTEEPQKHEAK